MSKRFGISLATALAVAGVALGQAPTTQDLPVMPAPVFLDTAGPAPEDGGLGQAGLAPPAANVFWVNAEYLLWWFKDSPVPMPLLTTTSNAGSMPVAAFADPNTTVLLGGQDYNSGLHQGARGTVGFWIDPHDQIAVEASYFFIGNQTTEARRGLRWSAWCPDPGRALLQCGH